MAIGLSQSLFHAIHEVDSDDFHSMKLDVNETVCSVILVSALIVKSPRGPWWALPVWRLKSL